MSSRGLIDLDLPTSFKMQSQPDLSYVEIKDAAAGLSCIECERWFKNQAQLKSHMWKHTGEKPFACLVCSRRFTQQGNLKAHQRIHTGERPYICTESGCDAKFTQKSNLKAHTKIHTGEKPFKCGYCTSSFRQATNLRTHRAIHTGERPYKCEYCNKTFTQKSNLKAHKDRLHRSFKKEPTECVTLSLSHSQDDPDAFYNNLNVMYTKDSSDSFEIPSQNEIIVETDNSVDYALAPTVEILIPETILSKEESFGFPTDKSDYGHMEIDIPYIKEEPSLNIEIVEGNIDDPYSCQICNNTYLSAGDLRIHQCIKGLRYFQCDLCKDCMPTLADLKNHQASHSEGKKYSCSLCGLIFINGAKLKLHHKLHNKINGAHSKFEVLPNAKHLRKLKQRYFCKSKSKTATSSRSVWKFRCNNKKLVCSQTKKNGSLLYKLNCSRSAKKNGFIIKMLPHAGKVILSRRDLKINLSQHYAVSYKHFLILQRKFIIKQSLKHQTENNFSLDSNSKFVPVPRTKRIARRDKNPSVILSQKKDIDPLFMCSECNSYFSCLGNIKPHMEIHRKKNAMKTENMNKDINSQNIFVISACLKYDEPIAQISRNE